MKHTREFKESAIQLVLNSNEEIKTIAQDLGMNHKTLYNWVYNFLVVLFLYKIALLGTFLQKIESKERHKYADLYLLWFSVW